MKIENSSKQVNAGNQTTQAMTGKMVLRGGHPSLRGKQAGFGLIEILIVIVISLLILIAIMSRSDSAFSSSAASTELGHVSALIAGTKQLKTSSGYGAAGADLTTLLETQGSVPADMTYSASKLYNQWSGQVTFTSTGLGFTGKYVNVPQAACVTLATKAAAYAYSTTINANAAIVGEVTSATAVAQCNSALANTLTWTING